MEENKYAKAEAFRYIILAAQRFGNRLLNELLKEAGLTSSQAEVLRVLNNWKNLSLKELGQLLICEAGSPSRLIERMCKDGLVEKIPDPQDSRYIVLQLTALGQEKAQFVQTIETHMYEHLTDVYSEDELESVCTLLLRLLKDQSVYETLQKRGFDLSFMKR
jgi:DNA-binding MarR family transcriptional regulator